MSMPYCIDCAYEQLSINSILNRWHLSSMVKLDITEREKSERLKIYRDNLMHRK